MSLVLVAAIVALVTALVLFFWGMALVRTGRGGARGQLIMWAGVAIMLAGGFATASEQIGFLMVLGGFALVGQALSEVVRARRRRKRPFM